MRFKATAFLSLILILLGGYLFYIELPGAKKKEEAESKAKRLFSISAPAITGVTIRGPEGTVELEHHPDDPDHPWSIVQPVMTVANDGIASGLASQLERLESTRVVEEHPTDLKPFGLDPPAYSILITLKHGANQIDTETLEVGDESLTKNEMYVRKGEGSPVQLTSVGLKQYLKKDLKEWRRREPFHFASSDVKRIRIESPQQVMEILWEGEGWRIEKPISEKGDPSAISNLLGSILNLRGDDFIDDQGQKEEKKRALGAPILKLSLTVGAVDQEAAFYKLKAEPEIVYAITTLSDPIYKIRSSSLQPLDQPASLFQEKKEETPEMATPPTGSNQSK